MTYPGIRQYQDVDETEVIDAWYHSGKATYSFLPNWVTLTKERAGEVFRLGSNYIPTSKM